MKNENGELVDAPDDDENDDSAEAEFARQFTAHYDEIGLYFPEFSRLRELVKLAAMNLLLAVRGLDSQATATNAEGKLDKIRESIAENVQVFVDRLTAKIPRNWPQAEDWRYVNSKIDEILEDQRENFQSQAPSASWYQIEQQARPMIRRQLLDALKESDRSLVPDLVAIVVKNGHNLTSVNLTAVVDAWVRSLNSVQVATILTDSLAEKERQEAERIVRQLKAFGLPLTLPEKFDRRNDFAPFSNTTCRWVPAAFYKDEAPEGYSHMIYGGVSLNVSFRATRLTQPPPTSSYQLSTAVLGAQRAQGVPYSAAVRMDNLAANNQRLFQNQSAANARQAANNLRQAQGQAAAQRSSDQSWRTSVNNQARVQRDRAAAIRHTNQKVVQNSTNWRLPPTQQSTSISTGGFRALFATGWRGGSGNSSSSGSASGAKGGGGASGSSGSGGGSSSSSGGGGKRGGGGGSESSSTGRANSSHSLGGPPPKVPNNYKWRVRFLLHLLFVTLTLTWWLSRTGRHPGLSTALRSRGLR